MAKKNARKPGGAAGIAVDEGTEDLPHEANGSRSDSEFVMPKSSRKAKVKPEASTSGSFGVGEIKKAAAFVNSVGGLDKAISILQILKVAKEVQ